MAFVWENGRTHGHLDVVSHLSTDRIGDRRRGDTLPESSVPKKKTRFAIGDKIDGKYEVVHILPSGGMGEVYKVQHVLLGDVRIVKVLRADQLANENGKQRFLREAKLAASIKDPNLAALYDFSALPDGSYYMVGEFVDGFTIGDHLQSGGRFEPAQVVRIAQHVLRALAALHGKGIIHRDISPDNLMLTRPGSGHSLVKVIDLGIAKAMDGGEGLTSAGFFIGKQGYASPEQLRGDEIDGRSDLYSLGVVLYQIVAGRLPFSASTPTAAMYKKLSEDAKGINEAGKEPVVDTQLEAFILRFLKKAPMDRFQTAEDALKEVDRVSQHFEQQDSTLSSILDLKKVGARPVADSPRASAEPPSDEGPATIMMPLPSKAEILAAKVAKDAREKPAPPPDATVALSVDELKRSTIPATTSVPSAHSSRSAPADATQMIPLPTAAPAPPSKPTAQTPATVILPPAKAAPASSVPSASTTPAISPSTQERKNSALTWIAIGVIALVLVAGAFGIARMFTRSRSKVPAATTPATKRVTVKPAPPVIVPPPVVRTDPAPIPASASDTAPMTSTGTTSTDSTSTNSNTTTMATPPVDAPPVTATIAPVIPKVTPKPPPKKKAEKKKPIPPPPPKATAPVEPARPTVQEGDLVSLGDSGLVAPVLRQDSEAKYPRRARMAGTKGTTTLSLLIDPNGAVENVRLTKSSGSPLLDNSALLAARKARYSSPTKDGVRVKVWITRDYVFGGQ